MADNKFEFGEDTRPLRPSELSESEFIAFYDIERRLEDARKTDLTETLEGRDEYLAVAQVRHPRVLLLDGGRGTGKTSLLLTLIERWRRETPTTLKEKEREYADTVNELKLPDREESDRVNIKKNLCRVPQFISVIDILDFDPLPRDMPLVAGIVQSLRPIADRYSALAEKRGQREEADESLTERWHSLFRMAATGWGTLPQGVGLVEQVLDREEQVKDWLNIETKWQEFVTALIKNGPNDDKDGLGDRPVFVIMIDDCDLQVDRISELLPALRMLYHPRVFFLVAAHKSHMLEMLKLNFFGRQNGLSRTRPRDDSQRSGDAVQWAKLLAKSSFEKVFPIRNRWVLPPLTLREVLHLRENMETSLDEILAGWLHKPAAGDNLRTYLDRMTRETDLPSYWTYRSAHQLLQQVAAKRIKTDDGNAWQRMERLAGEAIGRLLGGNDYDDLIQMRYSGDATNDKSVSAAQTGGNTYVEYRSTGRIEALFPQEFVDASETASVVLSASPDFQYLNQTGSSIDLDADKSRLAPDLLAISLQEDKYGAVTPRLQWEVGLAIAWSSLYIGQYKLTFSWRPYEHPSPLRLLSWSEDWRKFVNEVRNDSEFRLNRIAYAWIYHQLRWNLKDQTGRDVPQIGDPRKVKFNGDVKWSSLVEAVPERGTSAEKANWKLLTLPLLARPELGLPAPTQRALLQGVKDHKTAIGVLKDFRLRAITDALRTAKLQGHTANRDYESNVLALELAEKIDNRYSEYNKEPSPWAEIVGV